MKKESTEASYKNILVIVTGFLLIGYVLKVVMLSHIGLGLALLSIIVPKSIKYVLKVWNFIGHILGWVNTRILLTIVFYGFLFPISLLSKLKNKNMLQLRYEGKSLYKTRNHLYKKEDLENTW